MSLNEFILEVFFPDRGNVPYDNALELKTVFYTAIKELMRVFLAKFTCLKQKNENNHLPFYNE
jgi:hypothetical protein